MPRVTRSQVEQNQKNVVEAAARLFRERGIGGVSVPGVMAEAGLTHGAFYGHFASKEALAAEAITHAFEQLAETYVSIAERHKGDPDAARQEFVKVYTSRLHRDTPGLGCAGAALGGEVARDEHRGPVRAAFAAGLKTMVERLRPLLSSGRKAATHEEALARVAMLVGGQVLARATKGHAISDELLLAVRDALSPRRRNR